MMVVFFLGIGLATASVGLVQTPWQLAGALFAIGLFASIYHPVGSAMLVSYADRLGRTIGINGVWGNLGVACSALVTGLLCQYAGWRVAFILPGLVTMAIGLGFIGKVRHERRTGHKHAGAAVRISKGAMGRVLLALIITTIATSTTFNALTLALPKLFAERADSLSTSPMVIGVIVSGVYLFGALAQYTIGGLIDRHSLKSVFLPVSVLLAPLLWFGAGLSGLPLLLVAIGIVIGIFGQVTINDAMIGKYTREEWRARAYAVRYFVGFTAAGASVGLVAKLHQQGGFTLMLQTLGVLCLLVIAGALFFPAEERAPQAASSPHAAV